MAPSLRLNSTPTDYALEQTSPFIPVIQEPAVFQTVLTGTTAREFASLRAVVVDEWQKACSGAKETRRLGDWETRR
jgi:hypothetical protein